VCLNNRHDWYLKEWLAVIGVSGAWLSRETGWTHRITNQLINKKIRWNRDHLSLAAQILKLSPFELLLHPDEAMHLRKLKASEEGLKLISEPSAPKSWQ